MNNEGAKPTLGAQLQTTLACSLNISLKKNLELSSGGTLVYAAQDRRWSDRTYLSKFHDFG